MDLDCKIKDLECRLQKYRQAVADNKIVSSSGLGEMISPNDLASDLRLLKTAFNLRQRGLSYRKIAEKIGLRKGSAVLEWFNREKLPGNLFMLYRMLEVPRGFSLEFAYLLGAYTANQIPHSKSYNLIFRSGPAHAINKLERCVEHLWPDKWCRMSRGQGIMHKVILRYLRMITRGNCSVPWEHMGTDDERREYLRGIFDFRGMARGNSEFYFTKNSPGLLRQLLVLFADFDIYGAIIKSTNTQGISFFGSNLAEVVELKVLPENLQENFLHLKKEDCVIDVVRKYYSVLLHAKRKTQKNLAEEYGVCMHTIAHWIHGKNLPKQLQKFQEIENLRAFDTRAACFLYRNCAFSSVHAREAAEFISIHELMGTYSERIIPKSTGAVIEDVMGFKKNEAKENYPFYRKYLKSKKTISGKNISLYRRIKKINSVFHNEPDICRYFADFLSIKYKMPSRFIYEWLASESL